jgi:hypothetical protein
MFYRMDFDIVLLFGLAELKAQIAWKEGVSGVFCIPGRHWEVLIESQICFHLSFHIER